MYKAPKILSGEYVMEMYLAWNAKLGDFYDFQFVYSNGGEL